MNSTLIASLLTATTIAGGGWGAHEYLTSTYAEKGEVLLAQAKVDFVLDRTMSATNREIGYLEAKPNKKQDDIDRLRFLREQVKDMERVRAGK
jgi:hypothetical protein